ncbi:MAG TPA: hypothetical protein VM779_03690 [Thermoanaerobaculia bacterium]|nr:hypothetical protein [Thermoanaerobaculia bacterium]
MVGAIRLATAPRGFWHADEIRLAAGLLTFDGGGAPLVVALARLINVFVRDPFVTLVALSVIASVAGAILFGLAASHLLGNSWAAAASLLVAFLAPAMLVFGPLPDGTSVAVACMAAACWFLMKRRFGCFAVAAAGVLAAQPWLDSVQFRPELVVRFAAHPWGDKFLSLPILAAALFGAVRLRQPLLVAFGAAYGMLCVLLAPALDGVRPVIPLLLIVALFAVAPVARRPAIAMASSFVFLLASVAYAWPVVAERRQHQSPAVAALRSVSPDAVVIAAPDLVPFGSFRGAPRIVTPERLDEVPDGDLLVHGRSPVPGARIFGSSPSAAGRKLRGDRFHVVSLVPRPRYAARRGVYAVESSPERGEWRWLARQAVIDLPQRTAEAVELRFRLPVDSPVERNRLSVGEATVEILRGGTAELLVPAVSRLVIHADRTFTPPDGRELSVQLIGVRPSLLPFSTTGSAVVKTPQSTTPGGER